MTVKSGFILLIGFISFSTINSLKREREREVSSHEFEFAEVV